MAFWRVRKKLVSDWTDSRRFLTKSLGINLELNQGARSMLSEIFMLRLEAILRASNAPALGTSDTRHVPIGPPVSSTKDSQQTGKQA
jgi:hypothetical protein